MNVYIVLSMPDDPEYGSDWPVAAFTSESAARKYADAYPAPKGTWADVHSEAIPLDPVEAAYDHTEASAYSVVQCEAAVGSRATLPLTGTIVDAGESPHGSFVKFEVDERWGFGVQRFVLDLDTLAVES